MSDGFRYGLTRHAGGASAVLPASASHSFCSYRLLRAHRALFVFGYQRTRTDYGLTHQRIIILNGVFNRQVKSLTLAILGDITLTERANGCGSMTLGLGSSSSLWFGRRS